MTTVDPSSLLALGFCLLILAVGAGVLVVLLSLARSRRTSHRRRPSALPQLGGAIPTPERRPGEGPLWAESGEADLGLDEKLAPSVGELPYTRRRYLLTQAERDFFAVLRVAVPEGWYVFPQVRLANLVMLKKGTRNWKPHFSRVAQKCVDFVLCDAADIGPRLVVELDDSSHDRPDRQDRDRFVDAALRAAGLPILHVRWQRQYDATTLAGQIRAAAGLAPGLHQAPVPTFGPPPSLPVGFSPRVAGAANLSGGVSGSVQRWACRSCNAEVSANAKFCTVCGAQLEL